MVYGNRITIAALAILFPPGILRLLVLAVFLTLGGLDLTPPLVPRRISVIRCWQRRVEAGGKCKETCYASCYVRGIC